MEKAQKKKLKIKCPGCGKEIYYDEKNPHRPFCSELCKMEDIAAWAQENYRIPGQSANESDFASKELDDDEDPIKSH